MTTTIDTTGGALGGLAPPPRLELVVRALEGPRAADEREVEITLHHAGATVADLAVALGLASRSDRAGQAERDHLLIDGRAVPAGLPLRASGVRRGSVIAPVTGPAASGAAAESGAGPVTPGETGETGPGPALGAAGETSETRGTPGTWDNGGRGGPGESYCTGSTNAGETADAAVGLLLRTLTGPDAGRELSVGPGLHVLGRGEDVDIRLEDPVLARRQAVVEVRADGSAEVTDLSPPRPSRIDGAVVEQSTPLVPGQLLVVGSTAVHIGAPQIEAGLGCPAASVEQGPSPSAPSRPDERSAPGWTRALHRPPPPPAVAPVPPVVIPGPAPSATAATPLGAAALVATLVAGAAVAVLLHQPAFLLLGAVGAVTTLGAGLWQRGRQRSQRKERSGLERAALGRFAAALAEHQAAAAEGLRTAGGELADVVACVRHGGPALWARRPQDPGAFTAVVGRGDRFAPPALHGDSTQLGHEGWALVEASSVLPGVPITVELGPGAVVGVVGPRPLAEALARSLVLQLVVAHGPADLLVAGLFPSVVEGPEARWLRWLPHAREPVSGEGLVAGGPEVAPVLAALHRPASIAGDGSSERGAGGDQGRASVPHVLLVVHDPALLGARNTPARQLLAADDSASALVVADHPSALPGICRAVVEVLADGTATLHRPGSAELAEHVVMVGASVGTARAVALGLAGLHDPEQPATGAAVPAAASLAALLGGSLGDSGRMRARWTAGGADPPLRTLLAEAADGPVEVDLVRDGPHALVAGTTGAGKSELLRALVAGLAVGTGPDQLAFVLIDYKGGAAFDACAHLPHVAGLVTDLDEHLAERALRSLQAELRRRERILREVAAADLTAYRAVADRPALPRLVVVVDEFATLATDLPGFVSSLVGVAQRGRSLGVHLILATQRPAGAVSDDIRANTNLRIALRVQEAADSVDVVGDPIAATLPRHRPGRAVLRFGPGELVPAQVAAVTIPQDDATGQVVTARAIGAGGTTASTATTATGERAPAETPTVLETLVEAARAAAAGLDLAVHRPWLPSLPDDVRWEDLASGAAGLLDDPDRQAQEPWRWARDRGHLVCIGTVGAGTSTALASLALAAAAASAPSALHLYIIHGGSDLTALVGLPHAGAAIALGEVERQARLIRRLGAMLQRRADGGGNPGILLVVEHLGAWRHAVADRLGPELADLLDRILVDGPEVGIVVAGGLDRPGALPLAVSGAVGERLVFRLAEPGDAAVAGVRPAAVAGLPSGRAVLAGCGLTVQMARPADLAAAVASVAGRWGAEGRLAGAPPVPRLPDTLDVAALSSVDDHTIVAGPALADGLSPGAAVAGGRRPWVLPIGLGDTALEPVCLTLHRGDHLLIAGPARSGRSTALALLARQIRRADPTARVVALSPRASALTTSPDIEACAPTASDLSAAISGAHPVAGSVWRPRRPVGRRC